MLQGKNQIKQVSKGSQIKEREGKKSEYKNFYKEVEQIGKGSSGTVHLIKSNIDKKFYVAKKVILTDLESQERDSVEQESFIKIQILKKLNHPHIVGFVESFRDENKLIMLMEYCEQGDLLFHIKQKRQDKEYFSEKVVMNWFIQLTMAIDYIHDNKILHRDIKPSNVFLTQNGSIKLGDFGISKLLRCTLDKAQTLISPYHLSPETFQSQPYSYKSDIWALGCVLFEICSLKIMRSPNEAINSMYSKDLQNLVLQKEIKKSFFKVYSFRILLAKNPEDRPRTKQILAFPFVQETMKDFVSSKGFDGEIIQKIPIKKTQLHIVKEKSKQISTFSQQLSQTPQMAKKSSKENISTPIQATKKALLKESPRGSNKIPISIGSVKPQRKGSKDIRNLEEQIQKQMNEVKNDVQKKISEVKQQKKGQNHQSQQEIQQKPSFKQQISAGDGGPNQKVLPAVSRSDSKNKKDLNQIQQTPTQIKSKQAVFVEEKKSMAKVNKKQSDDSNLDDQYQNIQNMMNNIQSKVKQEYEIIKKESPIKTPAKNNQNQVNQQKINVQSAGGTQPKTSNKGSINNTQSQGNNIFSIQSNQQQIKSTEKKDFKQSKDQFTSQTEEKKNQQKEVPKQNQEQFQQKFEEGKIEDPSLLQDSNVSFNLSLTMINLHLNLQNSVFNQTAFKSALSKKLVNLEFQEQEDIEENINNYQDYPGQNIQVAPQQEDINELQQVHQESIQEGSQFKYQSDLSEIIKSKAIQSEDLMNPPNSQNSQNKEISLPPIINKSEFEELPEREDYIDSDEELSYKEDFDVSIEEEESEHNQKQNKEFKLTRKNFDKELQEVLEIYKSQLSNSTVPEEYNKFKHLLNMSEIPEVSGDYSSGDLSKKFKQQNIPHSLFKN